MTTAHDRRPPACHWDRALRYRVTRKHAPDCPTHHDGTCPAAGNGCQPCQARHCVVCGREHATPDRPDTCVECETKVARDLADLENAYAALATEAVDAGHDGHLDAAAPIPGGTAAILRGPSVPYPMLRVARGTTPDMLRLDHHYRDPRPPFAVLEQWDRIYRTWLGHTIPEGRRTSLPAVVKYLRDQLPYVANHVTRDAPDFLAFTRQVRGLRAALEERLHDEREPERGVECFECGERLERRFRPRKTCRHKTPARVHLRERLERLPAARARVAALEAAGVRPTRAEYAAALLPSPAEVAAARLPCPECNQGGIDDPSAGRSWECPGCRREYDRAEYAYAVRSSVTSGDGSGWWATVQAAADAVSDITGRPVSAATIRTWIERRDEIAVACRWAPGVRFGVQIVSWPDVLARATEQRSRGRRRVAS